MSGSGAVQADDSAATQPVHALPAPAHVFATKLRSERVLLRIVAPLGPALVGAATVLALEALDALPRPSSWLGNLGLAMLVLVMLPIAATAHELGHWAAARATGFRLVSLRLGRWELTSNDGRLRVSRAAPGSGFGLVSVSPRVEGLRWRVACRAAGGPLASLVLGFALLVAWEAAFPDGAGRLGFVHVLPTLGVVSLVVGIWALVPWRPGDRPSDGARILDALFARETWPRQEAIELLSSEMARGVAPARWDPDAVRAAASGTGRHSANGVLFAHLHAVDLGDTERAVSLLIRLLGSWPELPSRLKRSTAVLAALSEARCSNAARASAWMDEAKRRSSAAEQAHLEQMERAIREEFERYPRVAPTSDL